MNPVIKQVWLTRVAVAIWLLVALACFVLLARVAFGNPPLPKPTVPKWLVPRTNQFKAAALPQLLVYRWNYGTNNGRTTNFWWDLQVSLDLKTWAVLASNLGPTDITHTIITNDGARRFFRMRGRP